MQWHTPESSNFRWTFVRYWDGYVAHSVSLFVTYYDDLLVCSVWRQSVSRNFIISFPYCLSWLLHIAWSTYTMAIPLGYVFFLHDLRVMNESLTAVQTRILYCLFLHYPATSRATSLSLSEWFTPSLATVLKFGGR